MLKSTAFLASLLLSSTVLAGAEPAPPAPYPEGAPPQKADASNPGVPTDRLGNASGDKTSRDAKASKDAPKKGNGDMSEDDSDSEN